MMVREGGNGGMREFKQLYQCVGSTFGSNIFGVTELSWRHGAIHDGKWDPIWAARDEIERINEGSSWVNAWTVGRAGFSGNP